MRAEPNHLAGGHLNHSAKLSLTLIVIAERSQSSAKSEDCTSVHMDVAEDVAGLDEAPCACLDEEPQFALGHALGSSLDEFLGSEGDEALHGFGRVHVFDDAVMKGEHPKVFAGDSCPYLDVVELVHVFDDDERERENPHVGVDVEAEGIDPDGCIVGDPPISACESSGSCGLVEIIGVADRIAVDEDEGSVPRAVASLHGVGVWVPGHYEGLARVGLEREDLQRQKNNARFGLGSALGSALGYMTYHGYDGGILYADADMRENGCIFEQADVFAFGRVVCAEDALFARTESAGVWIPAHKNWNRVRDSNPRLWA